MAMTRFLRRKVTAAAVAAAILASGTPAVAGAAPSREAGCPNVWVAQVFRGYPVQIIVEGANNQDELELLIDDGIGHPIASLRVSAHSRTVSWTPSLSGIVWIRLRTFDSGSHNYSIEMIGGRLLGEGGCEGERSEGL
jgi:hypothetical protein